MMQSLRTSPNAALMVAFGAKSNIIDKLNDRNFEDKTVPSLTRGAIVSWRFIKKSVVKLHRPVQATHLPTSPLLSTTTLLWALKNSETGKSWTRSVASPPHENMETTSDPHDSSDASKAASHIEGISDRNLESDERGFTNGRGVSSAKNNVRSHTPVTDSGVQEDPDSLDRRQSDGSSPKPENGTQAERGNVGVGEEGQGENALMGGNENNDKDIPLGRKRIGGTKRKKKKAFSAGIATYDPRINSIRLKESATETPAASRRVDVKQQRQRSPRSSKSQPSEQGIQGAGSKSGWKDAPVEQVTGSVREFYSDKRSTGKSLGVEEGARLSRLLGLEDVDNIEQNPKLVAQDDARRENFGSQGRAGKAVSARVNKQVQQVRSNAFSATESVTSTAGQVVESISSTATQVSESVTKTANKFSNSLTEILKHGVDAEDEFEESSGSDRPEFRGLRGLKNYKVLQEGQGILVKLHDFYFFMMKKPLPEFALGMMTAPLALSTIFTLLYLPEFQGLAYDETARAFMKASTGMDGGAVGLELSWMTFFQVFMFSLSLSTGLQPDLAPLSPYTLVVANFNALCAQLILAFLSAAVFARLSQPSEPVRCSSVALICSNGKRRGQTGQALNKVLLTRCVLAGPQPCELINVKVDLMYRFNTVSSEGSFFRGSYSLKLVRSQIALLDHGMLVRHIIDENSPLYSQTPQSLCQNDAIFVLSVGGLERSSMQPIFHVQFYSVCDEQVIWNAEFEDMILINQKNQRVVDHSKLSSWRSL